MYHGQQLQVSFHVTSMQVRLRCFKSQQSRLEVFVNKIIIIIKAGSNTGFGSLSENCAAIEMHKSLLKQNSLISLEGLCLGFCMFRIRLIKFKFQSSIHHLTYQLQGSITIFKKFRTQGYRYLRAPIYSYNYNELQVCL